MTAIASAAKIEMPFMTASLAPSRYASKSFNRVALAVNARGGAKGANPPGSKETGGDGKGQYQNCRYRQKRKRLPTEAYA